MEPGCKFKHVTTQPLLFSFTPNGHEYSKQGRLFCQPQPQSGRGHLFPGMALSQSGAEDSLSAQCQRFLWSAILKLSRYMELHQLSLHSVWIRCSYWQDPHGYHWKEAVRRCSFLLVNSPLPQSLQFLKGSFAKVCIPKLQPVASQPQTSKWSNRRRSKILIDATPLT